METKVKKFSKKLVALFLAVLMVVSCFSGTLTAFAASYDVQYTDEYVEYNDLAWAVLSDEQAATALLDYLDSLLDDVGPSLESALGDAINGAGISVISWDSSARKININAVVVNDSVEIQLRSIDEVLYTLESVSGLLERRASLLGDAGNIQLTSTNGMRRSKTSSCDILRGVLGILQKNSADYNGKDVLGEFLRGGFDLGTIGSLASLDIYGLIGGLIGAPDGYESNVVYNIVQSLLFNNTNWFTEEEIANYTSGTTAFVYDDVLIDKLNTKLLQQINVEVTYPYGTTSSKDRYKEIQKAGGDKSINGYDPNLNYTEDGNVYLFKYDGIEPLQLSKNDSLFDFGYRALKIAWNSVLKDTLGTLHVNSNVDRGHGANFDNVYYYWAEENIKWVADINNPSFANNYSSENLNAWATDIVVGDLTYDEETSNWVDKLGNTYEVTNDKLDSEGNAVKDSEGRTIQTVEMTVYNDYGAESAEEFLGWVADTFTYDRGADGEGTWEDIDSTTIFGKLRYSPLADFGFNMTTGPINLYFLQTGFSHLDEFFALQYASYDSMVAGLNDALVAAVKDIFVDSSVRTNVYNSGKTTYPALNTTGNFTEINSSAITSIVTTLVENALDVLQYTADSTDDNILKAFYDDKGPSAELKEENIESAMIPLIIACIGNINLNGYPLSECIHPEDWNKCNDAESIAFVALREYLSYILPDKDYDSLAPVGEDGYYNSTLEYTILPMARDAVVYVMQGYVPVTDKSGNKWDVTKTAVSDRTTIFDLLNSVIAYYGGEYEFTNSKVTVDNGAMAVGALLGICDNNGKSLVNNDVGTSLWNTIDLIANTLLPTLGTLQYGSSDKAGEFNSEELIYNDIIKGIFEIGDTSIHSTGMGGVSNFLYRFLTIVSAEQIQSKSIINTVYDVLAEFLNALFGARYEGQGWDVVIPARTTENPFDNLLQKNVLAGTDGSNVGAIQKAICNFVEFCGYGTSGVNTYPDSILRSLMFALQAVNSFVPNAITPLGEFDLKLPTVSFANPAILGLSAGQQTSDSIVIRNNSTGINTAYIKDGQLIQNDLYNIKVKNIQITGDGSGSVDNIPVGSDVIAPGGKLTLGTTTTASSSGESARYKVTVTYDIYYGDESTPTFTDLTTIGYQFLSSQTSWEDVVYPSSRNGMLPTKLESDDGGRTMTYNGYRAFTANEQADLVIGYPEYIVLDSDNMYSVEKYQFRMRNTTGGWFGSNRSIDGWYCYDIDDNVFDQRSGQTVSVGVDNAIPVFDKETGALLNREKVDLLVYKESADGQITYYDVNGSPISASSEDEAWQRNGAAGYPQGEDSTVYNRLNGESTTDLFLVRTRDHVAYTLDEAYSLGIIQASYKNALGIYEYVYMKTGGGNNYDTTLSNISARGPVDGIYLAQGKVSVPKDSSQYTTDLFKYDGETEVATGKYQLRLRAYNSNSTITTAEDGRESYFVIGSRAGADEVLEMTDEVQTIISNYRPSDFKAIDETIGSKHYTDATVLAEDAVYSALSVNASPMTPETAISFADKEYLGANTTVVATQYGDRAYVPFTESNIKSDHNPGGYDFPVDVIAAAYVGDETNGVDGVYYYDEACTMPIYTDDPLTVDLVSEEGKDPAGIEVIEGTGSDAGKWYLKNAPSYERVWDTTTYSYPWYKINTDSYGNKIQAKNEKGELLYEQVTYVYRDKDSNKVNSDFDWLAKFPDTSYMLIENDGVSADNRGSYSQAKDYLTYVLQVINASIDSSVSNAAFTDISLVRNGLNNNNFEVITYNKMVEAAKTVERQYTLDITYYDKMKGETVTDEDVPFSSFNGYINNDNIVVEGVEKDDEGNVIACSGATVNASMSSVQIEVYKELFNTYLNSVGERGYLGDQLEKEILCASGNAYNTMTAVNATEDTNATITFNSAAVEVPFGALDENNNLVNEGPVVYADNIWNNYINSLASAVSIATTGNGDYAHKDPASYNAAQKATYTCQVTNCYTADTNLQAAEIALETATNLSVAYNENGYVTIDGVQADTQKPFAVAEGTTVILDGVATGNAEFQGFAEDYIYQIENEDGSTSYALTAKGDSMTITPIFEATGVNVTASLVVATTASGDTRGAAVNGDYTITLYEQGTENMVGTPYTFTSSADANSFTLTAVPAGTYDMVITSDYAITRTVTLKVSDHDITGPSIPVIVCNFRNTDTSVNVTDAGVIYQEMAGSKSPEFDLNGDGSVNITDAGIVYACMGTVSMPEITIQ